MSPPNPIVDMGGSAHSGPVNDAGAGHVACIEEQPPPATAQDGINRSRRPGPGRRAFAAAAARVVQIFIGLTRGRRIAFLALYVALIGLAISIAGQYFGHGSEKAAMQSGSVQVAGSETMHPVLTTCATDFMTRNPDADIVVKGGGSGDGIAALLQGLIDIGMVSRELSRRERDYTTPQGSELTLTSLALDGVTVIVNPANPATALDIVQLREIFSGKTRKWSELGGPNTEIAAFARAAGSGTAALFADRVLGAESYAASVRQLPTNQAIVAEVAASPDAIGYADLATSRRAGGRIKVLALRVDPSSTPVSPTSDMIRSGSYPLARTLSLATLGSPSGTAKAFIEFCAGASGQALLERAGYVAIRHAGP
jgi:phosphate transport system substrate-binding protein